MQADYSSSDEAPEEETVSSAKQVYEQKQKDQKAKKDQERAEEKEKRRLKDEQMKKQTEQRRQRHELSQDLLDAYEQEAKQEKAQAEVSESMKFDDSDEERSKAMKPKKTIYKKGPVTVKVLKKNKKTLAPPREQSIHRQRDRFLYRKSVDRRA